MDDYLAKECFYCGISAVDRMHSVYVRKDQDWGLWKKVVEDMKETQNRYIYGCLFVYSAARKAS